MALVVMVACTSDPFAHPPQRPAPAISTEWWSAIVRGERVGIEQRVLGEGQQVALRTLFRFRRGRKTEDIRRDLFVECDPLACSVTDAQGTHRYPGAIAPALWPPPGPYTGAIIGVGGVKEDVSIAFDTPSSLSWTGASGPAIAALGADGRPERVRSGVIDWQRETARPPLPEPVDIARLLAIPVQRVEHARRAVIGEYLVDGKHVRIDVPTWFELPAARDEVRALVYAIADAVRDDFVPGEGGAQGWFGLRRGDCTEHASALVEAARERGYNARTAVGYVYVDGEDAGLLMLHAWAEIELSGRWVAADAALRQFPADATHLRLGDWIDDLPSIDPTIEIRSIR